jgi:hypothetical protein
MYQISARSDFKYGRWVAILENQLRAITPELMAGSGPNFIMGTYNKYTWHNTRVFDWTWFGGGRGPPLLEQEGYQGDGKFFTNPGWCCPFALARKHLGEKLDFEPKQRVQRRRKDSALGSWHKIWTPHINNLWLFLQSKCNYSSNSINIFFCRS